MSQSWINLAYLVAAVCLIVGIRELSHPRTARRGNLVAAVGMAIAIVFTLFDRDIDEFWLMALGIAIGTAVGVPSARMVRMTAMPQMVALFNGVGGGAAALIAWTEFREAAEHLSVDSEIAILFSTVIGAISFWGSWVAFAKLQELISGKPFLIPGQHIINAAILLVILAGCVYLVASGDEEGIFVAILALASILGVAMVMPIGGADMPVVISMLNAFTGLAAAATGFVLGNTALIVGGSRG